MIPALPIANTILAYHVPYIMALLLCFVVLPIEFFVFRIFQRKQPIRLFKVAGQLMVANIASLLVGFIISPLLPEPFPTIAALSERYLINIFWGFIIAFLLSWFIEYQVIKFLNRKSPLLNLNRTVGYANMASYVVLYLGYFIPILFR